MRGRIPEPMLENLIAFGRVEGNVSKDDKLSSIRALQLCVKLKVLFCVSSVGKGGKREKTITFACLEGIFLVHFVTHAEKRVLFCV